MVISVENIVNKIKNDNLLKVILFGSHAYGNPSEDSDIDLLVVTKDNYIPGNYKERADLYLGVSSKIKEMMKEVSIDLIVHSMPMHNKFIETGSLFSKEILSKGKVLYEDNNF